MKHNGTGVLVLAGMLLTLLGLQHVALGSETLEERLRAVED